MFNLETEMPSRSCKPNIESEAAGERRSDSVVILTEYFANAIVNVKRDTRCCSTGSPQNCFWKEPITYVFGSFVVLRENYFLVDVRMTATSVPKAIIK